MEPDKSSHVPNGDGGPANGLPHHPAGYDYGELIPVRGTLALINRQKGKIAACFLLAMLAAFLLLALTPPVYRSDARLLGRVGRESLSMDPTVVGPTVSVSQSRESELNSELAILHSRDLLEKVVDQVGPESILNPPGKAATRKAGAERGFMSRARGWLGLPAPLPPRERAIEKLARNLSIEIEGKSNVISVGLDAWQPKTAKSALEELIRGYQERHIEIHGPQAPPQFFRDQVDVTGEALKKKEDELERFRQANGIADIDKQQESLLSQISNLQNLVAETDSQASASQARIKTLDRSLAGLSPTIELNRTTGKTNYAADNLKGRLADLRSKEADLAARYPEEDRMLTDLRRQIKVLEASLGGEQPTQTEVTTGVDLNYQSLQLALENERAQLTAQAARSRVLKEDLSELRRELGELTSRQVALVRLERERKTLENEYTQGRDNLQRAMVNAALDAGKVSSVAVLQPPTLPLRPVKPHPPLVLGLAALFGLCGALALAFIADRCDPTLRDAGDVRLRLGLPVLAACSARAFRSCIASQDRFTAALKPAPSAGRRGHGVGPGPFNPIEKE